MESIGGALAVWAIAWAYVQVKKNECQHKFEHYKTYTGEYIYGGGVTEKMVMKCEKCGKIEIVDLTE